MAAYRFLSPERLPKHYSPLALHPPEPLLTDVPSAGNPLPHAFSKHRQLPRKKVWKSIAHFQNPSCALQLQGSESRPSGVLTRPALAASTYQGR